MTSNNFSRHKAAPKTPGDPADVEAVIVRYLIYLPRPAWFVPGVVGYLLHRRTRIKRTSGVGGSAIHALMMAEASWDVRSAVGQELWHCMTARRP